MTKKWIFIFVLIAILALPVAAFAQGPVLLVDLPEDAQMVENIEFDDGDFIQTYQLSGGSSIQLLRYASFDMSAEGLAQSEWTGYTDAQVLSLGEIGGCPTDALSFRYTGESGNGSYSLQVTTVIIRSGNQTLVFEAVCPEGSDETEAVRAMLNSLNVLGNDENIG